MIQIKGIIPHVKINKKCEIQFLYETVFKKIDFEILLDRIYTTEYDLALPCYSVIDFQQC